MIERVKSTLGRLRCLVRREPARVISAGVTAIVLGAGALGIAVDEMTATGYVTIAVAVLGGGELIRSRVCPFDGESG